MNSPTPPVEDVLTRLRYCAAHGMFKAVEDDKHASYSEAADAIEALRTDLQRAREALDDISGAPLYRTRTDSGRVCLAEHTRDKARAALNTISPGPDQ